MAKYLGETERVKIEGNARKKEGRKGEGRVVLPTYSITAVMMKWLSKDEGHGTKTKERQERERTN